MDFDDSRELLAGALLRADRVVIIASVRQSSGVIHVTDTVPPPG